MKPYFKLIILFVLSLLVIFPMMKYYEYRLNYNPNNYIELNLYKILAVFTLNLVFFFLLFIVKINYYVGVFKVILIIFIILSMFILIIKIELPPDLMNLWELFVLISFSMISPGLILMIIYYIRNKTSKYDSAKLFGKYHIHEGFMGILLLIMAMFLMILKINIAGFEPSGFEPFSAILQIFIFIFLYIASFLISRDWHDLRRLKLIEKETQIKEKHDTNQNNAVFSKITKEDIHFFKKQKFIYYPFGMFLTFLSINLITFVSGYISTRFFITLEFDINIILTIGYISCILGGGLIGIDWFRLFEFFYPELYGNLEQILNNLKNS